MEHNPFIVQGVESSFAKCNASIYAKCAILDDGNNIELCGDAIIKANGHFFKLVIAVNKYVKTFGFSGNYLIV